MYQATTRLLLGEKLSPKVTDEGLCLLIFPAKLATIFYYVTMQGLCPAAKEVKP